MYWAIDSSPKYKRNQECTTLQIKLHKFTGRVGYESGSTVSVGEMKTESTAFVVRRNSLLICHVRPWCFVTLHGRRRPLNWLSLRSEWNLYVRYSIESWLCMSTRQLISLRSRWQKHGRGCLRYQNARKSTACRPHQQIRHAVHVCVLYGEHCDKLMR